MSHPKTILICPLNWGLGHATRCAPIIQKLIDQQHKVLIAAAGESFNWLQHQFPGQTMIEMPNLNIQYSSILPQNWVIASQFVKLKRHQAQNKKYIDALVEEHTIDVIISDNCFGCYHKDVFSIYMTHQLNIQGFGSNLANTWHQREMNNYNFWWIVDSLNEKDTLAHNLVVADFTFDINSTKIGLLSHLELTPTFSFPEYNYEVLVILSGPEPQRTVLLENAMKLGRTIKGKIAICGLLIPEKIEVETNMTLFPKLNTEELYALIQQAQHLIMRSGYSSLMDLSCIGREAWVIPTPGQSEQEYLHNKCEVLSSDKKKSLEQIALKVFPNLKRFKPKPYKNLIPDITHYRL